MGVKLTLLCEGTMGGKGVALYMYIAPTDLLIVFGEVSEGDGTDVSIWECLTLQLRLYTERFYWTLRFKT